MIVGPTLPLEQVQPMPINLFAEAVFEESGHTFEQRRPAMRALPTRQLHITAGNSPHIPFMSAVRALVTKSPAVIKSPYGAVLPGALLAIAAACQPNHPITRHLSIVYWPGGDDSIERTFFLPTAFDRIVVWGAPMAVQSVKQRALHTKVLTFDPRYGVSLIGKNADDVAIRTVCDALVANLDDVQLQRILDTEHGGMNEVLADVHAITGERKYLALARRF